jgi:hypothetical protein
MSNLGGEGSLETSAHIAKKELDWCCHLHGSCSSAMQHQMIVLAYLGRQCTKFHAAEWTCWFFISLYWESYIYLDAISRWIRQRNSVKYCVNLGRSATKTQAFIRQAFGEESMSRTRVFEWHAPFRADWRKWDRWKETSRAGSTFSLTTRGLFTKNSFWQVKRVNSTNYYNLFTATAWKCSKTCPRTLSTRELAVSSRLLTVPLPRNF